MPCMALSSWSRGRRCAGHPIAPPAPKGPHPWAAASHPILLSPLPRHQPPPISLVPQGFPSLGTVSHLPQPLRAHLLRHPDPPSPPDPEGQPPPSYSDPHVTQTLRVPTPRPQGTLISPSPGRSPSSGTQSPISHRPPESPSLGTQTPVSPGPQESPPPWAAEVGVGPCTLTRMSLDSLGLALEKDCPKQR